MNPVRRLKTLMNRRDPADFWQAILLIRDELNECDLETIADAAYDVGPDALFDAIRLLDRWLDIIIHKKWPDNCDM